MKTFRKVILRQFKFNKSKFISMLLIVLICIAFVTGLTATPINMQDSLNKAYENSHSPDIILHSFNSLGFAEEPEDLKSKYPQIVTISPIFNIDLLLNDIMTRIYIINYQDFGINIYTDLLLQDSRFKNQPTIMKIGDQEYNISHYLTPYYNPLYFLIDEDIIAYTEEPSFLQNIIYIDRSFLKGLVEDGVLTSGLSDILENMGINLINEYWITINDNYNKFSSDYQKRAKSFKEQLDHDYSMEDGYLNLSLQENRAWRSFEANVESLSLISSLLPYFFFIIVLLVVISNIYKKVDNDRMTIGLMKSLGFSRGQIRLKYILFSSVGAIIGVILGILVGFRFFPYLIWGAYAYTFNLPPLAFGLYYTMGFLLSIIVIITVILVAVFSVNHLLKEQPYTLLRMKSPIPGKKILLERINFIWKKLSWKYKSMFKNIFRYLKNVILTIFGIGGAVALLFIGIGLKLALDSMFNAPSILFFTFKGSEGLIYIIVIFIILFSLILSSIIIYSMISLVIDERKREIATLRVLGLSKKEVVAYIYREQAILASLGLLFGLGLGQGFLYLIIYVLKNNAQGIGSALNPYTYLITTIISAIFIVILGLLMIKRINNIPMLDSLKTTE
ncbi:MAG: ABC transporter permease [Acholeplasmatales bacterium]|nr:ABC transporter permease [Acholeplasmatales bacterium]